MSYDAWKSSAPDDEDPCECHCCGREIDGIYAAEVALGVYACSDPCLETILAARCSDCGCDELAGEEHSDVCLEVLDADRDEDDDFDAEVDHAAE